MSDTAQHVNTFGPEGYANRLLQATLREVAQIIDEAVHTTLAAVTVADPDDMVTEHLCAVTLDEALAIVPEYVQEYIIEQAVSNGDLDVTELLDYQGDEILEEAQRQGRVPDVEDAVRDLESLRSAIYDLRYHSLDEAVSAISDLCDTADTIISNLGG